MDRPIDQRRRSLLGIGVTATAARPQKAPEFHIASLVVHARPERQARIEAAITNLPGAEIHPPRTAGKLIVTLETASTAETMDRIQAIQDLPGIIAVNLIFHQWELDEGRTAPTSNAQG